MKDLITKGVSLHCKSGFDSDLVYLIAKKGNIRILEYLIHKNAAFDVPQTDSLLTPLLVAAHQGHLDCVKFLVKKGAKVNRVSRQGMSALYLAGKQKHYRIVKYLCSILGVIEFMESSSEKNTFMYGIVNKDTELVKILLEKEAAANIVGGWESEGEYPLHIAVRHNSEHLVQLLCSYSDSDIDIESPSDYLTPFMSAVLLHHFGVADILLQMGADPSHEGDQGCTLSQLGENKKNYLALKYLRERGIMGGMGGTGKLKRRVSVLQLDADGQGVVKNRLTSLRPIPPMKHLVPLQLAPRPTDGPRIYFKGEEKGLGTANAHTHTDANTNTNTNTILEEPESIPASSNITFGSDEEEGKGNEGESREKIPIVSHPALNALQPPIHSEKDKEGTPHIRDSDKGKGKPDTELSTSTISHFSSHQGENEGELMENKEIKQPALSNINVENKLFEPKYDFSFPQEEEPKRPKNIETAELRLPEKIYSDAGTQIALLSERKNFGCQTTSNKEVNCKVENVITKREEVNNKGINTFQSGKLASIIRENIVQERGPLLEYKRCGACQLKGEHKVFTANIKEVNMRGNSEEEGERARRGIEINRIKSKSVAKNITYMLNMNASRDKKTHLIWNNQKKKGGKGSETCRSRMEIYEEEDKSHKKREDITSIFHKKLPLTGRNKSVYETPICNNYKEEVDTLTKRAPIDGSERQKLQRGGMSMRGLNDVIFKKDGEWRDKLGRLRAKVKDKWDTKQHNKCINNKLSEQLGSLRVGIHRSIPSFHQISVDNKSRNMFDFTHNKLQTICHGEKLENKIGKGKVGITDFYIRSVTSLKGAIDRKQSLGGGGGGDEPLLFPLIHNQVHQFNIDNRNNRFLNNLDNV